MLADDLVQDTLSKAIKNQQQLQDHIKLDAWLFRILHNTWMEHLRRYRPTTDIDDIDPLEERTPERNLSDQQIVDRVQQAIFKLPVSQRQVVTLVDIEGSSYADVAEILAVPMGTVMSRLNRARNNLKKSLIGMRTKSAESAQVDYLRRVK
jgi:RNA polymerase sigma-70 factor (ECF subfamily)